MDDGGSQHYSWLRVSAALNHHKELQSTLQMLTYARLEHDFEAGAIRLDLVDIVRCSQVATAVRRLLLTIRQ